MAALLDLRDGGPASYRCRTAHFFAEEAVTTGARVGRSAADPSGPVLTTIILSPDAATVAANGTRQFTAAYLDQFGAPFDMAGIAAGSWNSTIPGIATINASGVATWAAAGATNITHTRGGITSSIAVLNAWAPSEAFVPQLEHWLVENGSEPQINELHAEFNHESFSASEWTKKLYDAGRGDYELLTASVYAGTMASASPPAENGGYSSGSKTPWLMSEEEFVGPVKRWVRFTAPAPVIDQDVYSRVNVGMALNGKTDWPVRLKAQFTVRGSAGKAMGFYLHTNSGPIIDQREGVVLPAAMGEVTITLEGDLPNGAGSLHDVKVAAAMFGFAPGDHYALLDMVPRVPRYFDLPANYRENGAPWSTLRNLSQNGAGQLNLPIHRDYGAPMFGTSMDFLGGERGRDFANVGGRYWTTNGWAITLSSDPGPMFNIIPPGNPGRFWHTAVVSAGATLRLAAPFGMPQMAEVGDALDTPVLHSCAGRVAYVHLLIEQHGANPVPMTGQLRARITGTAAYTGHFRRISDGGTTYHYLARVNIPSENVATAFTLAIEEAAGRAHTFKLGECWVERTVYNPVNSRNAGGADMWVPVRKYYGAGATGTTVDTMNRTRYDPSTLMNNPFVHTIVRRDFLAWPLDDDVRGTVHCQLKWFDSGPNATSALTYLWEMITLGDGVPRFRLYVRHDGRTKGYTCEWVFATPGDHPFRDYAFNDVCVIANEDFEVCINGEWFDKTSPNFIVVGTDDRVRTPWAQNVDFPLWIGMDRDLDCSLKGFMRAFAFHNDAQTRESVEAYCTRLNDNGVGSVP